MPDLSGRTDSSLRPRRVVIVDDSATMRRWLGSVIGQDDRLELVGTADSAEAARAVIKAKNPDVLTLDLEMPKMNGLVFLEHLMRLRPMPVVMIAASMSADSPQARKAIAIGAVSCITKPTLPTPDETAAMCDRIVAAAHGQRDTASAGPRAASAYSNKILLIGASTGGVNAIETLLAQLPEDIPPIVIAQHMPNSFLQSFVRRLDRITPHSVDFTVEGMRLSPGDIRIAPSLDSQTCVAWQSGSWRIQEVQRRFDHTFCPSVDVLFASAASWATQVGAVLLTGLGKDGAKGMLALRNNGARTLSQSRESCVVYGMPGAALALNASEEEIGIEKIGTEILSRIGGSAPGNGAK
jgi:two-component system, chemotaxis family, protein-glutamate methylesterase/glutaminase